MSDAKKYTSKLVGTNVLIVGGSSGIGFCVAEASLEAGASVIISSSQESRIKSSIERLLKSYPSAKDRISGHACDLSSQTMEENIKNLFSKISGKIDHIVITAGDTLAAPSIHEATLEDIQKVGMVRFFAPFLTVKHGVKQLSPGPASSITLTSGSVAERPMPGWTISASYAAGRHGMMRNLALDLAPVRVNLIAPGAVETELWDTGFSKETFQIFKQKFAKAHTTGKFGVPEDVAEAYLYVMRDQNCSGSVIDTNGGALLTGPT